MRYRRPHEGKLSVARFAFAAGALFSAQLAAQNTIVFNPEFDFSIGNWNLFGPQVSTWGSDDADSCAHSGSFEAQAFTNAGGASVSAHIPGECLDVAPDAQLFEEVTYRSSAPTFQLYLLLYPLGGCLGEAFLAGTPAALPPTVDWSTVRTVTTLPVASPVASVQFVASGRDVSGAAFVTWIDRPYLGLLERVFSDDFEAQSTCRWTPSPAIAP